MAGRTEVEIGEFTFFVRKFPPIDALRIVGNLQKRIIAPAAHLIATQRNEIASDADFAEGLRKLSDALDGDALVFAYKALVNPEYVSVRNSLTGETDKLTDNTVGTLDIGLDTLVQLAMEVAKINYMDFFKSATGLIGMGRSPQAKNLPVS